MMLLCFGFTMIILESISSRNLEEVRGELAGGVKVTRAHRGFDIGGSRRWQREGGSYNNVSKKKLRGNIKARGTGIDTLFQRQCGRNARMRYNRVP